MGIPPPLLRRQIREHLLFLKESGVTALAIPRLPPASHSGAPVRPTDSVNDRELSESASGTPDGAAEQGEAPPERLRRPLPVDLPDAAGILQEIRQDIGDCRRCRLCEKRTQIVFGTGNPRARLMFVGEGPGQDEDRQGIPFVGRAGQLLNRIIEAMGMRREEVYIANVVKCRPPENRTPLPDEVATCSPFLFRQITAIRPEVICTLGSAAVQALLGTSVPVSRLRGKFSTLPDGTPVMPTFHPAYLLRNSARKKEVWEDMKEILVHLGLPVPPH